MTAIHRGRKVIHLQSAERGLEKQSLFLDVVRNGVQQLLGRALYWILRNFF